MGHEKTLTALLPALAGANVIYGLGNTETGVTMDYGQMVMDNEFAGLIKFTLEGIPVNDETMAVDVIREVGPSKDFLSHEHTYANMRTAQTHPELLDRRIRADWMKDGGKSIYERSWEKALDIIENHQPKSLSDDVKKTMREVVLEAEDELGVSSRHKKN
jgi:trimethylamine--corrinoid protein Co-methyltransferase